MIKFKKFVRNNIKFFVGIIFGIILSIGTSFAATIIYDSDEVRYDNTTSGMTSTDVQGALDELYARRPQGNATADQVLSGNTFSNATTSGITGTMQNLSYLTQYQHTSSNATKTLLADASYYTTLYNNSTSSDVGKFISFRWNKQDLPDSSKLGNGYITTNTLFTRPASDFGTAKDTDVLTGKSFTSENGLKINGAMANRGAWSKTVSTTTAQTGAAGYYSSVSCAKAANSGTFTTSKNSSAVDMGANQNYRYVNTTGVYSAGRTQGQNDVKANPSGYGISGVSLIYNAQTVQTTYKFTRAYKYVICSANGPNSSGISATCTFSGGSTFTEHCDGDWYCYRIQKDVPANSTVVYKTYASQCTSSGCGRSEFNSFLLAAY